MKDKENTKEQNWISISEAMELLGISSKVTFQRLRDQNKIAKEKENVKESAKEQKWISTDEAMELLRIRSKATLQRYRDEGRIRFSQPDKKIILYDRDSIMELINKHKKGKP